MRRPNNPTFSDGNVSILTHSPNQTGLIIPFVLSVLLHGIVAIILIYNTNTTTKVAPAGIETYLVGQDELSDLQGKLAAAASNAAAAKPSAPSTNASRQNAPLPEVAAYNTEILRREAEYRAQMAEFAAELDNQIAAELAQYNDELQQTALDEARALQEAQRAFANTDQAVAENLRAFDEVRSAQAQALADKEAKKRQQSGRDVSVSAGGGAQSNSSASTGGNEGAGQKAASAGDKNALIATLIAQIKPHWRVPAGASGERLRARIKVDGSGNVTAVNASGGNAALQASLESAVRAAAPFSVLVGTPYQSLTIDFVAE